MDLVDLRFPTTIANLRECVVNHVYYADQTQIESMCSASAKCECAEVVITVWSEVRCVHVSYSSQISTRLLHISITHTPHRVSTASRRSFFFLGGGYDSHRSQQIATKAIHGVQKESTPRSALAILPARLECTRLTAWNQRR
jgi:hypothetical protein